MFHYHDHSPRLDRPAEETLDGLATEFASLTGRVIQLGTLDLVETMTWAPKGSRNHLRRWPHHDVGDDRIILVQGRVEGVKIVEAMPYLDRAPGRSVILVDASAVDYEGRPRTFEEPVEVRLDQIWPGTVHPLDDPGLHESATAA